MGKFERVSALTSLALLLKTSKQTRNRMGDWDANSPLVRKLKAMKSAAIAGRNVEEGKVVVVVHPEDYKELKATEQMEENRLDERSRNDSLNKAFQVGAGLLSPICLAEYAGGAEAAIAKVGLGSELVKHFTKKMSGGEYLAIKQKELDEKLKQLRIVMAELQEKFGSGDGNGEGEL